MSKTSKEYLDSLSAREYLEYKMMRLSWPEIGDTLIYGDDEISCTNVHNPHGEYLHCDIPNARITRWETDTEYVLVDRFELERVSYNREFDHAVWIDNNYMRMERRLMREARGKNGTAN